jgi:diguanylate cyclase (GGDEF)-like protein/PAS domain S-box-containing protein
MAPHHDTSFDELFKAHPLPMWVYDLETLRFLAVNRAATCHYGFSEGEFLSMTLADLRPSEELPRLYEMLASLTPDSHGHGSLWRHRKKDGSLIDVEITYHPIRYQGRAARFVLALDVTEQLQAQRKIARLNRIYAVFSGISAAIVRLRDRAALFREACRLATVEGGMLAACIELADSDGRTLKPFADAGKPLPARLRDPESCWPAQRALREHQPVILNDVCAQDGLGPFQGELARAGVCSLASYPFIVNGRVVAVLTLFADSAGVFDTELQKVLSELIGDLDFALLFLEREDQISYLAYHDVLTALPNRRLFMDRLGQLLAATPAYPLAVVMLDIDRFGHINNALGRHAGDALLTEVARRLTTSLPENASVARTGGDSFSLVLTDLPRTEDAVHILQNRVLEPLAAPFLLDGQEVRSSVRAGLALHPTDGKDAESLFRHAESALKNAKRSGQRYLFYAPKMNAALAARLTLENQLQTALAENQFDVYYQPRVNIRSGRITSAEALIRWRHPKGEVVGPVDFIPLAEETGLIGMIGTWVIEEVCAQQARWLEADEHVVPVAVNLSAMQSTHGDLLRDLRVPIERNMLPHGLIEFELTETAVMHNPDEAEANLNALKGFGVQLSLDDFGTGYSSLSQLKRFPFDFVKIDRSFVAEVDSSPNDEAIAAAIIAMAHSLGLRVVAEGVETESQLGVLRKLECDEMQGYLFSAPLPPEQFIQLLRRPHAPLPA